MKKRNLVLCLFLLATSKGFAQINSCVLNTYGYSRALLGGAAPVNAIEVGGKEVEAEVRNNREYFIYLKTCAATSLTITSVWIKGTSYSAKAIKSKTPVVMNNTSLSTKGIKETLVTKSTSPVWQLLLSEDDTILKPTATMQKLIKSNALVITGLLKGKKFSTTLKSLKELQPLAAQ
jgi:hypothetical protein